MRSPFLLVFLISSFLCGASARSLNEVAPGVYAFKDTCNVYAIVNGTEAILIDFGSGAILSELPSIGVRKVDWILHTHFHRDQAQGDKLARTRGIKLAVPAAERRYFEDVEKFWNEKKVMVLYDMRNEFLALRESVAVDYELQPNTVFSWNGKELKVIETSGHTEGSLSFLLETGLKRLLFCGDLVASEGKIPTMHDLEWPYVGTRGIEAEMRSLNTVREVNPDMLLPSHGSPSQNPLQWIPELLARLAKLYHAYDWPRTSQRRPNTGPVQISKHIWQMRQFAWQGVGYLIVADSGHAMLWDVNRGEAQYLEQMRKKTGFTGIDLVAASHYHDDHVSGINAVKAAYGTNFWAMDHMVDILEHPMAYNLPCLWPEPIKVNRVLHDGERVLWEGIPLQFFYLPGQTEYSQSLLIEIDGKRLLFDGDNVARPLPGTPLLGHFCCRNYQRLDGGHVYAARKLLQLKPDFVCPNHYEWSLATPEVLGSYLRSSEETGAVFRQIIDQPDPQIGVDNNWISFYPYQVEAGPGDSIHYELRIRNWIYRKSQLRVTINTPEGWTVASDSDLRINIPPKSQSALKFDVRIPHSETRLNCRFVLTADVWRDGEHLGEINEALVNMRPMKIH
jgi:glyoxylase-like metal-dependent hydrolase (beta-lactamase superfamily II)